MENWTLAEIEKIITYSDLLGLSWESFHPTRITQNNDFTSKLIKDSLNLIPSSELNYLEYPYFFYGTLDFMIRPEKEQLRYVLVEANGGSSRGFTILPEEQIENLYEGLNEILEYIPKESAPLILIGYPKDDILFYEKLLLAQNWKNILLKHYKKVHTISLKNFSSYNVKNEATIVLADYPTLLKNLHCIGDTCFLFNTPVNILLGDGIARRHYQMRNGIKHLNLLVINEFFPLTDDKFLTYNVLKTNEILLNSLGVYSLPAWHSNNVSELETKCKELLKDYPALIIKPLAGSGGAGVQMIDNNTDIKSIIHKSILEFREKFNKQRNPFPYTICEKISPEPANWNGELHNYDLRIYLTRKNNKVIPLGGMARIAMKPITDNNKKGIVVSLSGYKGLDAERGIGFSRDLLKMLHLNEIDLKYILAASVVIINILAKA